MSVVAIGRSPGSLAYTSGCSASGMSNWFWARIGFSALAITSNSDALFGTMIEWTNAAESSLAIC